MAHAHGAYLGSVRSIADVRLRCVVDAADARGCWHLRTAHGRALPRGKAYRLWVHGRGAISAPRAVWELDRGMSMPRGRRAVRMCESYDCGNPAHIKALTHSEAQRHIVGTQEDMTAPRRAQLLTLHRARRRFTEEQLRLIRQSPASSAALARELGCSATTVASVRAGRSYRDSWAPAASLRLMRVAA